MKEESDTEDLTVLWSTVKTYYGSDRGAGTVVGKLIINAAFATHGKFASSDPFDRVLIERPSFGADVVLVCKDKGTLDMCQGMCIYGHICSIPRLKVKEKKIEGSRIYCPMCRSDMGSAFDNIRRRVSELKLV